MTAVARIGLIAVAAYAGAQVIAQVTSLKIGVVFDRAVDMGTFVYPITFTLRDVVHKALGRSAARTLIVASAGVNLFLAAYLRFTDEVESDPAWGLGDECAADPRPDLAHRDRLDRGHGRERADRHRGVPLVRHPRHHPLPVGSGAGQQRRQHADRQPHLRRRRVRRAALPGRPTRHAALGDGLGASSG